mmetsp:Transcript_5122/g.16117  ORF Transcript_5122/g.16117 Transcript_5122/m.16117 type:complete len:269 (-) Transcript_5122:8-814(-)
MPKAAVTKAAVPKAWSQPERRRLASGGGLGVSSEKTKDAWPSRRSSLRSSRRRALRSRSPPRWLFLMGALVLTWMRVGSVLPPAPPRTTTLTPRARHAFRTCALSVAPSTASTTTSAGKHSSSTFDASTKSSTLSTCIDGLMSRSRAANTETLGRPIVDSSAWTCRLQLLTHTSSKSMSLRCPTPDRARASAVHEPTPPTPQIATLARASAAILAAPYSRSVPSNRHRSVVVVVVVGGAGANTSASLAGALSTASTSAVLTKKSGRIV